MDQFCLRCESFKQVNAKPISHQSRAGSFNVVTIHDTMATKNQAATRDIECVRRPSPWSN